MGTGQHRRAGVAIGRRVATASLALTLLLGGLATAATGPAPAAAQEVAAAGQAATVGSSAVNVRTAPTLSGTIVTTLAPGTAVTLVSGPVGADGFSWYQVARDGVTIGWSVNAFLLGTGGGGGIPTAPGDLGAGDVVSVTAGALNIRATPSTAAAVVGSLAYGARVTLTGAGQVAGGFTWYPIAQGWVVGTYLAAAGATTPPTTPPPAGGFAYGTTVTVTADQLNVRATPTTSAAILTTYGYGTRATITGGPSQSDGITWYAVDNFGWVSGAYLQAAGGTTTPPTTPPVPNGRAESPYTVAVNAVNVRAEPSTGARIVTTVYLAQRFSLDEPLVRQQADGYSWVRIPGLGWIAEIASPTLYAVGRPLVDPPPTYTVAVAANVRAQPTTLSQVLTVAPVGTAVTGIDFTVDTDGIQWLETPSGWIAVSLLTRT